MPSAPLPHRIAFVVALICLGWGGPVTAAGRIAIIAPQGAAEVERAAVDLLQGEGYQIVPGTELGEALGRVYGSPFTANGRLALVTLLDLRATATLRMTRGRGGVAALVIVHGRNGKVERTWKLTPTFDGPIAEPVTSRRAPTPEVKLIFPGDEPTAVESAPPDERPAARVAGRRRGKAGKAKAARGRRMSGARAVSVSLTRARSSQQPGQQPGSGELQRRSPASRDDNVGPPIFLLGDDAPEPRAIAGPTAGVPGPAAAPLSVPPAMPTPATAPVDSPMGRPGPVEIPPAPPPVSAAAPLETWAPTAPSVAGSPPSTGMTYPMSASPTAAPAPPAPIQPRSYAAINPSAQTRPPTREAEASAIRAAVPPVRARLRPILEFSVGPRFVHRRLDYDSDPDGVLADFKTAVPTLALGLGLGLHPLPGGWRPLGIRATFEQGRAFESRTPHASYTSPNSDLTVGFDYLLSFDNLGLAATFGYGRQKFAFRRDAFATVNQPQAVPDIAYHYLRPGLELRTEPLRNLSINIGLHYRHLLAAGDIASRDWFPNARIIGFDTGLGLSYRFSGRFSAEVGVDARLYRYSITPERTATRLTDGVLDLFYAGYAALHVAFGGTGP